MYRCLLIFQIILYIKYSHCSAGDSSIYYQNCLEEFISSNCSKDGIEFKKDYKQPLFNYLLQWTCRDECKYQCMWKTVETFQQEGWPIPQFHGKWPFIRIFGIQEPASALFSLLNLYAHVKMIMKFVREVRPDSPLYKLWCAYFIVSCHTWMWSTVFHMRDTLFTELMDYTSAFAMVLMNCYCMTIRLLRSLVPRFGLVVVTCFFLAFYLNHFTYLRGKFDYGYNMKINIIVGTVTAILWFVWCIWNRNRQPYVYKCALFVTLSGVVMLLEVMDIPPILWIFDSHSLWHLSTAPVICIFYSFVIDDCKYLRKQEVQLSEEEPKNKKKL